MAYRGRVVLALLTATGFAVALVAGHHPWDGPEVLEISETHGLHLGDLPVLVAWVVGAGLGWRLWSRGGQ